MKGIWPVNNLHSVFVGFLEGIFQNQACNHENQVMVMVLTAVLVAAVVDLVVFFVLSYNCIYFCSVLTPKCFSTVDWVIENAFGL